MTPTVMLLFVSFLVWQQALPHDAPPRPPAGTASLSGRVTDKETGEPIARVAVVLLRNTADERDLRYTVTADDGRFTFTGLPPGSYGVVAEPGPHRPFHVAQAFGAALPLNASGPTNRPEPVLLREGESRGGVDIALPRAFAFGGIVVNQLGEPLADVRVEARRIRAGRAASGGPSRWTDDRGAFRFFGLLPGRYRVCAESSDRPTHHRIGLDRLTTTCYPSATRAQDAGGVTVGGAGEPSVQIRMQQSRTFTITGIVLDGSGAPAGRASLTMGLRDGLERSSGVTEVGMDGRFTISNVIPGEYGIRAYARGSGAYGGPAREVAYERVRIEADDVHVVLSMKPTATVAGHVVWADASAPVHADRRHLSVTVYDASGAPLVRETRVGDSLTFALEGLYGPVVLGVQGAPDGWVLASVHYAGVDVTDTPTEFMTSGDATQLRVTLTRRTATVSGRVVAAGAAPVAGAEIYLFSAVTARWTPHQGVRHRASSSAGTFTFEGLEPGEYLMAAVRSEDAPDMSEREDYELLAKVAERVTLAEGSNPSITLRVARFPEDR